MFVPTHNYFTKRWSTSEGLYIGANIPFRHKWLQTNSNHRHSIIQAQNNNNHNTINSSNKKISWWYHTPKDSPKTSRMFVIRWGVQVIFKGSNTIKTLLVAPKDRDNITKMWVNLQVQVWPTGLQCTTHRVICRLLEKAQRTFQGPFPHLWPWKHLWSLHQSEKLMHSG